LLKKEQLRLLEKQVLTQDFDLFYGDATTVSEKGYVPYGWQFKEEEVSIAAHTGKRINLFGLYDRNNQFHYWLETGTINADKIVRMLDQFSWKINRRTVIVLDNASPHRSKKVREMIPYWEKRGLHLFFLPPYSPHLNIVERLWKEIKARFLEPQDYLSADDLFYGLNRICANIGTELTLDWTNRK